MNLLVSDESLMQWKVKRLLLILTFTFWVTVALFQHAIKTFFF